VSRSEVAAAASTHLVALRSFTARSRPVYGCIAPNPGNPPAGQSFESRGPKSPESICCRLTVSECIVALLRFGLRKEAARSASHFPGERKP
jgi:hypothetical protein